MIHVRYGLETAVAGGGTGDGGGDGGGVASSDGDGGVDAGGCDVAAVGMGVRWVWGEGGGVGLQV